MTSAMNPGHESCIHDHKQPIYAYNQQGEWIGYLTADHCFFCGAIIPQGEGSGDEPSERNT